MVSLGAGLVCIDGPPLPRYPINSCLKELVNLENFIHDQYFKLSGLSMSFLKILK